MGMYLKKPKTLIEKNICAHMFTSALFTIANIWKQPKCLSVDEWIKKAVVHLHNGTLLSCKREGNLTFCNSKRMNLESTTLSEISQSEKDKYHMISLMCGI